VCDRASRVELFEGHARAGDVRLARHGTARPFLPVARQGDVRGAYTRCGVRTPDRVYARDIHVPSAATRRYTRRGDVIGSPSSVGSVAISTGGGLWIIV